MLPLRPRYSHQTLDNIFRRPASAIPYEEAPEVAATRIFPTDRLARIAEVEVRCLGRRPFSFTYPSSGPQPEGFRIYELRDVMMYRGILYSRDGRFFADSVFLPLYWNHANAIHRSVDRLTGNVPVFPAEFCSAGIPAYLFSLGAGHFPVPRPIDPAIGKIASPCLYFHSTYNTHFGHAFLETPEKLWAAAELEGTEKPFLWSNWTRQCGIPECVLAAAEAFGFVRGDFLTSPEVAIFKKIYLASSCYRYGVFCSERAMSVFQRIAAHYAPRRDPRAPRRLYVSRVGERNRRLVDEEKCEEVFRRRGFTVIHPERLGWAECVPLFAHATHVAGCIGSAMHRRLLMRPESRMLHLTPRLFGGIHEYAFNEIAFGQPLSLIAGTFLNDPGAGPDWAVNYFTTNFVNGPWKIDPEDLETGIEQWLRN